jgi:uncharacterized protein YdaU (DUF1376 family)
MNYFELYPGDYLKATQRLTLLEHGVYLRLLMAYYGEEAPLPADQSELNVMVGAMTATDRAAVVKVAERFFPVGEDGLRHNDRADAEIEKAQRRIQAARRNGSKGGRKPNPEGTQKEPSGLANGLPSGEPTLVKLYHTPCTTKSAITETSIHTPPDEPAAVGVFEGQEPVPTTPNPAAAFAIVLNRAGHRCTSLNPELVGYVADGGTVDHLSQVLNLGGFTGKPAGYVLKAARRELAEKAAPIEGVTPRKAEPARNPEGPSPVKVVTAESKRQERIDYAANMVRFGTWTQSQADSYLGGDQ